MTAKRTISTLLLAPWLLGLTLPAASAALQDSPGAPADFQEEDEADAPEQAAVEEPVEPLLKAGDQKKLAKAVAEYFEAKREDEGVLDALGEVEETIAGLEKRLKGASLMQHLVDLELALGQAGDHGDSVKGKGRIHSESFDGVWQDSITYVVHAPKGYRAKSGPYPLMLVVPDADVDLEQQMRDHWEDAALREEAIVVLVGMPASPDDWAELGSQGVSGGVANVLQVLGRIQQDYRIDPNRVFLAGYGRGVATAGIVASRYPHVFAGVIGRAGDLDGLSATNFANLPSLFVGGADGVTAFASEAEELGFENANTEATAEIADVWAWASQQRRDANPRRVVFAPSTTYAQEAYWLRVGGYDPEAAPSIQATIDRGNGVVDVTGDGFFEITLAFNDHMLDLDRPVRVVINGVEHETKLQRSLPALLNRAFSSGDTGRLFVVERTFPFTASTQTE